jgi:hypothetical protein
MSSGRATSLLEEAFLLLGREGCYGGRERAGSFRSRPCAAEAKEPQSRGRQGCRDSAEIGGTFSGQDVSQEVVVDDDDGH